jgi:cytochrome c-type biogenesis protein CcmH/NrfG
MLPTLAILTGLGVWGLVTRTTQPAGDLAQAMSACDLKPPHDLGGLEACLARAPSDVELLLDLGAAYEAAGRPADARSVYRRAVETDPRDADARVHLGTALRRSGDAEGARREGGVALGLRPNDPVAFALASPDGRVLPDPQR